MPYTHAAVHQPHKRKPSPKSAGRKTPGAFPLRTCCCRAEAAREVGAQRGQTALQPVKACFVVIGRIEQMWALRWSRLDCISPTSLLVSKYTRAWALGTNVQAAICPQWKQCLVRGKNGSSEFTASAPVMQGSGCDYLLGPLCGMVWAGA